ncbi:hypothetical protein BB560_006574 [Smittium megazygosporum]|uniref:Major facilitator superfamily (MFS) profile domain-containing protein n=1 Tax=Smittium megazygosporum TaxID=133381 RepID=A0A2T9Y3Q3_9FUNG|nr:hypothetical protein BB560_006574 [Smittium megazygosporum]
MSKQSSKGTDLSHNRDTRNTGDGIEREHETKSSYLSPFKRVSAIFTGKKSHHDEHNDNEDVASSTRHYPPPIDIAEFAAKLGKRSSTYGHNLNQGLENSATPELKIERDISESSSNDSGPDNHFLQDSEPRKKQQNIQVPDSGTSRKRKSKEIHGGLDGNASTDEETKSKQALSTFSIQADDKSTSKIVYNQRHTDIDGRYHSKKKNSSNGSASLAVPKHKSADISKPPSARLKNMDEIREEFQKAKDPPGITSLFPENNKHYSGKRSSARRIPSQRFSNLTLSGDEQKYLEELKDIASTDKENAYKKLTQMSGDSVSINIQDSNQLNEQRRNIAQSLMVPKKHNRLSLLDRNEIRYVDPDSKEGWKVVLSCFFIHFFSTSSQGLLYLYSKYRLNHYVDGVNYDSLLKYTDRMIMFGIIGTFFLFIGGFVSSYISFRLSFSFSAFVGSIFMAISLFISSFTTQGVPSYIFQYIFFGFGMGLTFYPAYCLPTHWFKKKIGLAMGVSISGALVGVFCLFPLIRYLLGSVGIRNTLRIHSLIILAGCSVASLGLKSHYLKSSVMKFFNTNILYDTRFVVLALVSILSGFGQFSVSLFISDICYINGLSQRQEGLGIIFLYLGTILGSNALGIASDKFGSLKIIGVSLALTGLFSAIFWTFAKSFAVIIVYFVLIGFANGGFAVALPISIRHLFGLVNLPTILPILMYSTSFIVVSVVPSLRPPKEFYPVYKRESIDLIVYGGVALFVSGVLCLLLPKMQHDYLRRLFKSQKRIQSAPIINEK